MKLLRGMSRFTVLQRLYKAILIPGAFIIDLRRMMIMRFPRQHL